MDASTRWETAAIRSTSRTGSRPPRPSAKRQASTTTWVTLKEAEETTSIPVNTLRKWVRKADLPSYLESDGDIALRMVDLDAVISRAKHLGRSVEPLREEEAGDREPDKDTTAADAPSSLKDQRPTEDESTGNGDPGGTMIVPIDAFNKMLSQLGNLHEAGQQLAVARERAAKAETEATFLRERLAELRSEAAVAGEHQDEALKPTPDSPPSDRPPESPIDVATESLSRDLPENDTTTYWRYLTRGWAERRRLRP